jgi:hypothetical protein
MYESQLAHAKSFAKILTASSRREHERGIIVFHTFSSTTARKYKGENENGQKSSKY